MAEIYRATDGRPMRWATLQKVQDALGYDDATMTAVLVAAAEQDWVEIDPLAARGEAAPHSVSLTDAGRQVASRLAAARLTRQTSATVTAYCQ